MNRKVITLVLVLVLGVFAQASLIVDSYQGYHGGADCSVCHNEPATAYNETFADASITADGIADEDFWEEDATKYHTMYLPVAGSRGSGHTFVRTVFAQNSTHLFIKMDWEDLNLNGTDDKKYDPADGFSIYWNMDNAAYDGGFPDGMKTENGTLDVWTWKAAPSVEDLPNGDVNLTETVAPVESSIDHDYVMNTIGLASDGNQDVTVGATYGNQGSHHEDSYQVEVVRALETGDESDIQFNASGYYTFGLAIFNDSAGEDHLMGFEHDVWIWSEAGDGDADENDTPFSDLFLISIIGLVSVSILVVNRRKNM